MNAAPPRRGPADLGHRGPVRDEVVDDERPAGEWIALLASTLDHDARVAARIVRTSSRISVAGTTLTVAVVVVFVAGAVGIVPVGVVAGVVAVLALVLVVVLATVRAGLRRRRPESGPLRLAAALMPILDEDAAPGAPVAMRLDLTGHRAKDKALGRGERQTDREVKKRGSYHRIVETTFDDPFLHVGVRFADGARVSIDGRTLSRSTRKTKKTRNNKVKTKTKVKTRSTYDVRVRFPASNYAPATGGLPEPPGTDRDLVRTAPGHTDVRLRRTVKQPVPDPELDAAHVVDLLARAYTRVEPSRRKKLR